MLDFSHVPGNQKDTQIFYAISGSNAWQTWQKPRGAKMIYIFCIGSGAGGAGGALNAAGSAAAEGGGGGGGSSYSTALFPSFALPDTLYIKVARGGTGSFGVSTAGWNTATGSYGDISYVSVAPSNIRWDIQNLTLSSTLILASGTTPANGGLNTSANNGIGGKGGTVFVPTTINNGFSSLGIISTTAGPKGGDSKTGVIPPIIALSGGSLVTGGSGGGGRTSNIGYNGGDILAASILLTTTLLGGTKGTSSTRGRNGNDGYGFISPVFCGVGGTGGGGVDTARAGGNGGNGFYGCGGGGGGTSQVTLSDPRTGDGGRGGDGLVIITTIF